jgi:hypothetical protein
MKQLIVTIIVIIITMKEEGEEENAVRHWPWGKSYPCV